MSVLCDMKLLIDVYMWRGLSGSCGFGSLSLA